MTYIFLAMIVSFGVTLAAIRLQRPSAHAHAARSESSSESKMHGLNRAGGIGVAAGLLISLLARLFAEAPYAIASAHMGLTLLVAVLPIFAAGLLEDFTQRIGIWARLLAALASALLAGWMLGAWIPRFDFAPLDAVIAFPLVSALLTCVLVAGVTHAFNIIDGFNGLAGGVAALILLGIAYVAFKAGDIAVLAAALTAVGAIAGFMLLNFPRGLIYLGDGGAYLLGFWIGVLLVMLIARNPDVSAWFPVLLCSYPVCELLFSIYRRVVIRRAHPGLPDVAHLHHLIYMRLVRWLVGSSLPEPKSQRNALTAPYLWIVTSIGVVPSVVFWQSPLALQIGCLLFAATYVYCYVRIAKFRAPRWWVLRKPHERRSSAPETR
ncbi:MAG: glycosyl transferase family 4 [Betaproteobacteria bacterium]|nr:glycosyl transferase family 4 [Betaproteobacteria bacterium]